MSYILKSGGQYFLKIHILEDSDELNGSEIKLFDFNFSTSGEISQINQKQKLMDKIKLSIL